MTRARPRRGGSRGRSQALLEQAAWWAVRPAQSHKPSTYRCPLCGGLLPALSQHMLIVPEGDPARRRHAHTACVMRARRAGRLPLRDEVEHRRPGLRAQIRRLVGRGGAPPA